MGTGYQRNARPPRGAKAPGARWIDEHMADLPNNNWVAASDAGVIAQDAEIGELMDILKRKKINPVDVTIIFVTPDPV
jgi:hypothetical protein